MASLTQADMIRHSVMLSKGSPQQAEDLINLSDKLAAHYKVDKEVVMRQTLFSIYRQHEGPEAIRLMKRKLIEVRL